MKKFTFFFVLFCLTKFAFAQSSESFYEKALEKEAAGDPQYAASLMDNAIRLDSHNVWYWLKRASIQLQLREPYLALDYLRQAIAVDSTEAEAYNQTAIFFEKTGSADSAIYMYNKAIAYAESDTMAHKYINNRGVAKATVRDFEGSLLDHRLAHRFNPKDLVALNSLSLIYSEMDKKDSAILYLKKMIDIDSSFIAAYTNLGFVYSQMDSIELALFYFNKTLEIHPNMPHALNNRGYAYYKKGAYHKALKDVNKSLEFYPSNAYAYRNLALIYIATDKIYEACNAIDYALAYGFTVQYGDEVILLKAEHCKD